MEKNSKAMHSDVYNFKENQKKVQILDSRELLLPNGKVLGHRDYRHIYKQHIVIWDTNELKIMWKLALEYKDMVSTVAVQQASWEILKQKTYEKRF